MIKKHYTIILFLIFSTFIYSQKPPGMLGKRNLISYNFTASTRSIANIFSGDNTRKEYKNTIKDFTEERNLFRSAHNFHYMYILKRSFGIGIVYNYEIMKPNTTRNFVNPSLYHDSYTMGSIATITDLEDLEFIVHTIKPSIMWTAKESFLPVGYRNILSIGPRFVDLKNQSYYVGVQDYSVNNSTQVYELDEVPNQVDLSSMALDFSYTGVINYPVTKSIMIELGLTFRTAFGGDISDKLSANRSYLDSQVDNAFLQNDEIIEKLVEREFYGADYSELLQFENLTNIFSMQFGVAFAL